MEKVQLEDLIGIGKSGKVYKAQYLNPQSKKQEQIVVKELDYKDVNTYEKQQIVSEVNLLRECRHQNIVKYIDRIVDKENQKLFILMEYCENGDLQSYFLKLEKKKQNISEENVWKFFKQLILAFYEIHRRKDGKIILHRDIKPQNILLDSNYNIKLGDFGVAKQLNEIDFSSQLAQTQGVIQQTYYKSPEQIYQGIYTEKSEIYCLGQLLYEMCCVNDKYQKENYVKYFQDVLKYKSNQKKINIAMRYTPELQRVINWCLQYDEFTRPNVDDLLNLPNISMQLRENRLKENTMILQKREEESNKKLQELQTKEKQLDDLLKDLEDQEKKIQYQINEFINQNKVNVFTSNLNEDKLLNKNIQINPCNFSNKNQLKDEKQQIQQSINFNTNFIQTPNNFKQMSRKISSHNSLFSEDQQVLNSNNNYNLQNNQINKKYKVNLKNNKNLEINNDNNQFIKKQLLTIHKTTTNIQNNNYITYNFNNNFTNQNKNNKQTLDANKKFLFQS